jgi:adenosine deaminase
MTSWVRSRAGPLAEPATAGAAQVAPEQLLRLPKTDLHVHLDGSLRPATMLELARERNVALPASDPEALAAHMVVDDARHLEDYLARFEISLALMQDAEALERIAYELVLDAAADGVRYMEVRWCPALNTRGGLSADEALEAPLRGFERADAETGTRTAAIVCGLRTLPPAASLAMAELAAAYRDRGVVGFDLAGSEAGNPPGRHAEAFRLAARAGVATTCHAGEGAGPESVWEALIECGARRIGHGTRIAEDPALLRYVNDFRIPIEVCLTSNVQTRATRGYADHPLGLYLKRGLVVSLNTDNRLMSGTTMTDEFRHAHEHQGLGWGALRGLAVMGFESAFLPHREKAALLAEVAREIVRLQ